MSEQDKRSRNMRLGMLFAALALMLFALWYEYKVARPSVEAAYGTIAELNDRINTMADAKPMTCADVQQALQRKPARVIPHGDYRVEVYSWLAGLPFLTRNYYAVYLPLGGELRFVTHFMWEVPWDELDGAQHKSLPAELVKPPSPKEDAALGLLRQQGARGKMEEDKGSERGEATRAHDAGAANQPASPDGAVKSVESARQAEPKSSP